MSKFEWSKGSALEVHVHLSNTFMNELTAVYLHRIHDFVALLFFCHHRRKCTQYDKMGLVARKPVFGVSVKESFKPVSSATETS